MKIDRHDYVYILNETFLKIVPIAYVNNSIYLVTYRQCTKDIALFLKLHSITLIDIAVDCFAADKIDIKYRFTIIYRFFSSLNNDSFTIVTKTNESLALVSLQDIFPSFN